MSNNSYILFWNLVLKFEHIYKSKIWKKFCDYILTFRSQIFVNITFFETFRKYLSRQKNVIFTTRYHLQMFMNISDKFAHYSRQRLQDFNCWANRNFPTGNVQWKRNRAWSKNSMTRSYSKYQGQSVLASRLDNDFAVSGQRVTENAHRAQESNESNESYHCSH